LSTAVQWKIGKSGETPLGTFAELGLSALRINFISQAQSKATFVSPGSVTPLFAYGDDLVIYREDADGLQGVFMGRVIAPRPAYSGQSEDMLYELADPWWWLDNIVYQQAWNVADGTGGDEDPTILPEYRSRVILCQDDEGNRITSGAVIQDVIGYAVLCGANMRLVAGSVSPDVKPPWDEALDITCAEAIKRMLRWTPDAVTWFDFSDATRAPVFYCRTRAELAATTIAAAVPADEQLSTRCTVSMLDIAPRNDLVVPGVIIKYEQRGTWNGVPYEIVTKDSVPVGTPVTTLERTPGVLLATIELAGFSRTIVSEDIETEDIPTDLSAEAAHEWWEAKLPSHTLDNLVVTASARASEYPRELVAGRVQDWMNKDAEEETIHATIEYTLGDDETPEKISVAIKIIVTDAETQVYNNISATTGEPIPVGLAASIYAALQTLQYEGRATITEEEISRGGPGVYNRINFSGLETAYETMNAQAQIITWDVDSGTTTLHFGPPAHLAPDELLALLRANRGRRVASGASKRISAKTSDGSGVVSQSGLIPKETPTIQNLRPTAAGLDLSKVAFGYEINPDNNAGEKNNVRINAGEVDRIGVATADFTISSTLYIYVRITFPEVGAASGTLLSGASVPADTSEYKYLRLHKFTYSDPAAVLSNIYRLGDITGVIAANTGGLPDGTADYQVPVWNDTTQLWAAGRVRAMSG